MGYLLLAYRNLTRRRLRSSLTISAVAIIIIAFFTLAVVYTTIDATTHSSATIKVGRDVGYPYLSDLIIVGQKEYRAIFDPRPAQFKPELDNYQDLLAKVEALPSIEAAAPHVGTFALKEWLLIRQDGSEQMREDTLSEPMLHVQGIDPTYEEGFRRLGSAIVSGDYLEGPDDERIIVGYRYAKYYNVQVGDTLRLIGNDYERDFEIAGIFMTMTPDDGARAFVTIPVAQELLGTIAISDISILINKGMRQEASEAVSGLTSYTLMFPTIDAVADVGSMSGLWNAQRDNLAHSETLMVLGFLGWLFVFQAMSTAIYDRTREIGIMKAIGWARSDVWRSVLVEAAVIGMVGGSIGYFAGVATPVALTWLGLGELILLEATLTEALGSIGLATVVCLFAALIPADMAANVLPLEAMRKG